MMMMMIMIKMIIIIIIIIIIDSADSTDMLLNFNNNNNNNNNVKNLQFQAVQNRKSHSLCYAHGTMIYSTPKLRHEICLIISGLHPLEGSRDQCSL